MTPLPLPEALQPTNTSQTMGFVAGNIVGTTVVTAGAGAVLKGANVSEALASDVVGGSPSTAVNPIVGDEPLQTAVTGKVGLNATNAGAVDANGGGNNLVSGRI